MIFSADVDNGMDAQTFNHRANIFFFSSGGDDVAWWWYLDWLFFFFGNGDAIWVFGW